MFLFCCRFLSATNESSEEIILCIFSFERSGGNCGIMRRLYSISLHLSTEMERTLRPSQANAGMCTTYVAQHL